MPKESLVLLHPPSVYDFREHPTLWGPISDLVPSTPIFDMYPIGFITLAEYLERHGYRVRIANLAVRMLLDPKFDVDKFIGSLNPAAFGIDLHWLPHVHGSLEIASLIKRTHPDKPVIMGGLSSSYFHEELIKNSCVDYVLRGDSTEEPLRLLLACIESGARPCDLERVPNLTWKDGRGIPRVNNLSHVPHDIDELLIDQSFTIRAVIRDLNLSNYLPFTKWLRYPITAALTCRGCTLNCTTCGGSSYTYGTFYGRREIAFRAPELVARDIRKIGKFSSGPIFILGDIRQAGIGYTRKLLRALQGIESQIILEFFWPVDRDFIEEIAGAIPNFVAQLSPESHDPAVLRYTGKLFTGESIRSSVGNILIGGCRRVDVFFMIGMPGQTYNSVLATVDYCRSLLHHFRGDPRLKFFISPLAPFLDPGSLAYEKNGKYGYRKLCQTLRDHYNALVAPSWKYVLSYETRWMSRSDIVDSTYQAALKLNRLKSETGQIGNDRAMVTEERILRAIELMKRIDALVERGEAGYLQKMLTELKPVIDEVNCSTVCDKEELELPVGRVPVKILRATGLLIGDRFRGIFQSPLP